MSATIGRVPPQLTWVHQACFKCFKQPDDNGGADLKRCSGCHRVSYCSTDCQKNDWRTHKGFCKAYADLERDTLFRTTSSFSRPTEPSDHYDSLHNHTEAQAQNKQRLLEQRLRRQLTVPERNLVGWEPRCVACTWTDQDLRMEGVARTLRPCLDCKISFFCSDEHREWARASHAEKPCEDGGPDGLSQCALNREVLQNLHFADIMAGADAGPFTWVPERVCTAWTSLEGKTWSGEYAADLKAGFRIQENTVPPFVRGASGPLSIPLTILWALEKLVDGTAWTHSKDLTVHIIGASQEELGMSSVFEEILHRLPELKNLKVVLIGPDLALIGAPLNRAIDIENCPNCRRQNRKRVHILHANTYHDFVRRGVGFTVPGIAVAFNSGMGMEDKASWKESVKVLVEKHIPTLFTSYNKEETIADAQVLRSAGAQLVPGLGPETMNPWGSLFARTEPNKVCGFYGNNRWLAGGFK
ncbi:hypothetical protein PLICRDRAFT_127491 [Plicaturopsis crispa FD-325 SS-3]|nr:hypothetical protein PLICRDRAFT_127491 [Plicaturopsis crispa FD-325 SS-3]